MPDRKSPEERRAELVALWVLEESAGTLTVRDVKSESKLFVDDLVTYQEWLSRAKAVEDAKAAEKKRARDAEQEAKDAEREAKRQAERVAQQAAREAEKQRRKQEHATQRLAFFEQMRRAGEGLMVADVLRAEAEGLFDDAASRDRFLQAAREQQIAAEMAREIDRATQQDAQKAEKEQSDREDQLERLQELVRLEQLSGRDITNAKQLTDAEKLPFIQAGARLAEAAIERAFDRHSNNIWGDYESHRAVFKMHDTAFGTTLELEWRLRVYRYLRNRAVEEYEESWEGCDAALTVKTVNQWKGRFTDYANALADPEYAQVVALVANSDTPASVRAEWDMWFNLAKDDQLAQGDRRGPSVVGAALTIAHAPSQFDQQAVTKMAVSDMMGRDRCDPVDFGKVQVGGNTPEFLARFDTVTKQFQYCFGAPTEPEDPSKPDAHLPSAGIGWLVKHGRLDVAVANLKKLSPADWQLLRKFTSGYIVAANGFIKPALMRLQLDLKGVDTALGKGGSNDPQGDGLQAVLYQHFRLLANLNMAWAWLTQRAVLPWAFADITASLELIEVARYSGVAALQAASLLYGWDRQEALRLGSCDGSPTGDWAATKVGADTTRGEMEADGFTLSSVIFILNRVLAPRRIRVTHLTGNALRLEQEAERRASSVVVLNLYDFRGLAEALHASFDPAQSGLTPTERNQRQAAIEAMPAEKELSSLKGKSELKKSDVNRLREKLYNKGRYDHWYKVAAEMELEKHLAKMDEVYAQLGMLEPAIGQLWDMTSHMEDMNERIALMGLWRFKASVAKGIWNLVLFSEKMGMLILDEEKDVEAALAKRELPNGRGDVYAEAKGWMTKRLAPSEFNRLFERLPVDEREANEVYGRAPSRVEVAGIMTPMQPYLQAVVTIVANKAGQNFLGRLTFRGLGDRMVTTNFETITKDNFLKMADLANLMLFAQGSFSRKGLIRGLLDAISDLLHIQIKL